jgi:hypothetical protein
MVEFDYSKLTHSNQEIRKRNLLNLEVKLKLQTKIDVEEMCFKLSENLQQGYEVELVRSILSEIFIFDEEMQTSKLQFLLQHNQLKRRLDNRKGISVSRHIENRAVNEFKASAHESSLQRSVMNSRQERSRMLKESIVESRTAYHPSRPTSVNNLGPIQSRLDKRNETIYVDKVLIYLLEAFYISSNNDINIFYILQHHPQLFLIKKHLPKLLASPFKYQILPLILTGKPILFDSNVCSKFNLGQEDSSVYSKCDLNQCTDSSVHSKYDKEEYEIYNPQEIFRLIFTNSLAHKEYQIFRYINAQNILLFLGQILECNSVVFKYCLDLIDCEFEFVLDLFISEGDFEILKRFDDFLVFSVILVKSRNPDFVRVLLKDYRFDYIDDIQQVFGVLFQVDSIEEIQPQRINFVEYLISSKIKFDPVLCQACLPLARLIKYEETLVFETNQKKTIYYIRNLFNRTKSYYKLIRYRENSAQILDINPDIFCFSSAFLGKLKVPKYKRHKDLLSRLDHQDRLFFKDLYETIYHGIFVLIY